MEKCLYAYEIYVGQGRLSYEIMKNASKELTALNLKSRPY